MFTRPYSLYFATLLTLGPVVACSAEDHHKPSGTVHFTISGETLALGGYPFPATNSDDVVFVDGWEVRFERMLVSIGKVTLSEAPDKIATDQSETSAVVAEVEGPWVVDLHQGGPLPGKGGSDEQAVSLARVSNQNKRGNIPFATDQRYAFSFNVVPPSATAQTKVDTASQADYQAMVEHQYSSLVIGTATFKGTNCRPKSDPVLATLPTQVKFRFGFKAPTTYLNCQNPDNDPAAPLGDEEHQRGIAIRTNTESVAQVTLHTDHLFWESVVHDSPAHFDQFAALAKLQPDGSALVTLEDLKGVNPRAFNTSAGNPLPWRSCVPEADYPLPATHPMGFDTKSVPVNPSAAPESALRDLYDYVTYNASTMGHLNADGLCFVQREYPSPP